MLRINLLPSYVSQRRLTQKLILGFGTLLVLCILIPLLLYIHASQQKASWENQATAAEAGKAKTDQLRQQAQTTTSQIAPIQAEVDYVKAVHQHNNDIVTFWNTVAEYSDPKVVYSDAVVSGNTLTIKAYTPSIAEIGRYLQAMYQEPDFQSVGIDKLPGYPEAVVSKYYLGNHLIAVGSSGASSSGGFGGPSSFGGGPPGGFGGGGGGFGGARGGFGGGPPGGFGGGGGFGGNSANTNRPTYGSSANLGATGTGANVPVIGANGGSNGQAGAGQVDTQKLAQVILAERSVKNVVLNPFAPPQSQYQAIANLVKKVKVRREPQGFPVTITAILKQPLAVPQLPGTAAATTAGGGPGGYPGMMGGPGGYPGGPPPGAPGGMPPGGPGGGAPAP